MWLVWNHPEGILPGKLEATGISLSRYQASTSDVSPVMDSTSSDEKLRELMHKSSTMKFIKKLANKPLTVSGLGLTLKAYCVKLTLHGRFEFYAILLVFVRINGIII